MISKTWKCFSRPEVTVRQACGQPGDRLFRTWFKCQAEPHFRPRAPIEIIEYFGFVLPKSAAQLLIAYCEYARTAQPRDLRRKMAIGLRGDPVDEFGEEKSNL
jgi:hypothetical protein